MRDSFILLVGIALLLSAALVLSISIVPYPFIDSSKKLQPLVFAEPTNQSTIAFSTSDSLSKISSYFARVAIFDVNGSYSFYDNSSIKIRDTMGNLVFDYPVRSGNSNYYSSNETGGFPIRALLTKEGTYVASFENVNFESNTFLMAYSTNVEWIYVPTFFQYIGFLLVIAGVFCFSIGWIKILFKSKEEKELCFKENEKLTDARGSILLSIVSLMMSFVVIVFLFQVIKLGFILQVATQLALSALMITYVYFSIKKLKNISSLSYEKIRHIEFNSKLYIFFGSILFSGSFILSFLQNSSNFLGVFGLFLYFIAIFIFSITCPFYSLLTEKGKLVLPLRKFCKDYNKDILDVDYTLLAVGSKKIRDHYKSIGLMISPTVLTVGMYSSLITAKGIANIEKLNNQFSDDKCSPEQTINLIKGFISEGCELEKIKIKALPSFLERYSHQVKYFATTLAIIATIITIAQFALGIH